MKDLALVTLEALRHYGDGATEEFFRRLQARQWMTTRCCACKAIAFPPRSFCRTCHHGVVEWVELPRQGALYAFTQQDRAFRFATPDVIGLVELHGVGRLLSRIDAPFEALQLNQIVELDFYVVSDDLVLHQFRPVGSPIP